jgi:hypothetical protein
VTAFATALRFDDTGIAGKRAPVDCSRVECKADVRVRTMRCDAQHAGDLRATHDDVRRSLAPSTMNDTHYPEALLLMAWTTLQSRLAINPSPVPYVLAGPMLREVTPLRATVWFALRAGAKITVRVFNGTDQQLEGSRHTTAIGTSLHIVAVTATLLPSKTAMAEGMIYEYDAVFDFDDASIGAGMTLTVAAGNRSFGYAPFERPSFCLPPKDINKLRLIHGSCRHANGEGEDSLAILDRLIAESAANSELRPHQLLLMGDQIYADDVGGSMLLLLTEASDALLGWQEVLPVTGVAAGMRGNELPPYWRHQVARDARFTSDSEWNHILTLGEYLCMYMFVWSDVPWDPNGNFPTFDDVRAAQSAPPVSPRQREASKQLAKQTKMGKEDVTNVNNFAKALSLVRRALANIPTYTILDDHDVTDDYNMTRDIAVGVYENPMGRRVVQNAMTAYALCQHWGNVPDQFAESDPASPGMQLLSQFASMDQAKYDTVSPTLQQLAGVHDNTAIMTPPGSTVAAVFHDAGSFIYNYTIEGPGHQIIVTDSRTWRSFPHAGDEAPELLPQSQIERQIGAVPETGDRALIVVLSTNMPPVPIIRFATRNPWISNHLQYYPDLFDSWELPSPPFDRLAKALTDRLPKVNGVATGPIILLSGDVHSSFATRVLFKGTARLNDSAPPVAVNAVFAQLISSSLRNQTSQTVDQHHQGYDFHKNLVGKATTPEAYAGWNIAQPEAVMEFILGDEGQEIGRAALTLRQSQTVQLTMPSVLGQVFNRQPDWAYRLDYLAATSQGNVPIATTTLPPFSAATTDDERRATAEQFKAIAGDYRNFRRRNTKRQMVGVTNLSEVTFAWGADNSKHVIHTARWRDPDAKSGDATMPLMFTTYAVSLDPDDANFAYEALTNTKVGP